VIGRIYAIIPSRSLFLYSPILLSLGASPLDLRFPIGVGYYLCLPTHDPRVSAPTRPGHATP